MDSDILYILANILYPLSLNYSLQGNLLSLCVFFVVEGASRIGILEADNTSDSFDVRMSQHDPHCLFRSVRP